MSGRSGRDPERKPDLQGDLINAQLLKREGESPQVLLSLNANVKVLGAVGIVLGALVGQHIEESKEQLAEPAAVEIEDRLGFRVGEVHADHLVALPIDQPRDELDQVERHLIRREVVQSLSLFIESDCSHTKL